MERLQSLREEYHVEAGNLYNIDEKGFVLGSGKKTRLVIRSPSRQKDRQLKTAGNRDFVTVVETVFIKEILAAPIIIFKAKSQAVEWAQGLIPTGKYSFYIYLYY